MPIDLRYTDENGLRALPDPARVLGVLGYAADRPSFLPPDCPYRRIELPCLAASGPFEVWTAAAPVRRWTSGTIAWSDDGTIRFGMAGFDEQDKTLEETAYALYQQVFAQLAGDGALSPLRFWNYLPRITAADSGDPEHIERYRGFNRGRHDAFESAGRDVTHPPAASALGMSQGVGALYLLAARQGGLPLENPRQVSAYRYPALYGPRSPTFSRGLLDHPGAPSILFISGTASIVGHESRHPGDIARQTEETLANIAAVTAEAVRNGLTINPRGWRVKAYLRDAVHLPWVTAEVERFWPDAPPALYLRADICRPELLVEIEAANFTDLS